MSELPTDSRNDLQVARRAARGVLVLGARQAILLVVNVGSGILMARIFHPLEMGFYALVTLIFAFSLAISDLGFGASLIRQDVEPGPRQLRAVFCIQQIVAIALACAVTATSSRLSEWYDLPGDAWWCVSAAGVAAAISTWMIVPQARLERHLGFSALAWIEVTQSLVFNCTIVVLGWSGAGIASFAWGMLAKSVVGAFLLNVMAPWPVGVVLDWSEAKRHFAFGLPYQAGRLISMLKDMITPVAVGLVVSLSDVGLVHWAQMVATYPVIALFMLQRIYLPAFSRLRALRDELRDFVELVIWFTNALVAPLSLVVLVLIEPITVLVFGEQWRPGISFFLLLWGANLFVPTAAPAISILDAHGLSRISLQFTLIWMFGTWVIGLPLILMYGTIGYPIANLVIQSTNLLLLKRAQQEVPFRIASIAIRPWILAAVVSLPMYFLSARITAGGLAVLALVVVATLGGYCILSFVFQRRELRRARLLMSGR